MKKILFAMLLLIAGCDANTPTLPTSNASRVVTPSGNKDAYVQEFSYAGHQYILISFAGESGGAICHAEHCPCKNNKIER